jgi:UDP-N-acetylmuramyl pentapeptide phosphotransferase/UDP-N-acetylglucosamine-1-phosphate transferase
VLSTKNRISRYVLLASILVVAALAWFFRPVPHYAHLSLSTPAQVQIDYLWQADISQAICQEKLVGLDELVRADCPDCTLNKQECLSTLNEEQLALFKNSALPLPSIRLRNGIVTYQSTDPQLALQTCLNAQNAPTNLGHKLYCLPSHSMPSANAAKPYSFWLTLIEASVSLLVIGLISWFLCYLILRYEHLHEHFSHDHAQSGPQKFHTHATPRVGGIAIYAGLLAGLALENILHTGSQYNNNAFLFFVLASTPVFFGGIIEDVTKNVGVAQRLLFSMLSAALAILMLGAVIDRTDIPYLDLAVAWAPFAVAFTILGISGVCNAVNIIDGYNGLSAGYAMTALVAIMAVAFQVNDHLVFSLAISLLAGLLGFLCWNWPKGKIFMGDGGAYLVGFGLAELCIMLLYRNESVSPWFTASIMAYPIFETLFSIFRRIFLNKAETGQPDAEHLHHLIFKKVVLKGKALTPESMSKHNSCVAAYIWAPAAMVAMLAVLFWQSTAVLMPLTLMGCVAYVLIYLKLLSTPN